MIFIHFYTKLYFNIPQKKLLILVSLEIANTSLVSVRILENNPYSILANSVKFVFKYYFLSEYSVSHMKLQSYTDSQYLINCEIIRQLINSLSL